MPTLYIIDGYAQFFRAYHAIRTPMTSPVTKEPTNMTFGFIGMLLKLLRGQGRIGADGGKPDYVCVTLDVSGDRGTFRSQIYPEYKATRDEPPDDLEHQVERCLALLRTIGVPILGAEGFEADDVIATLVTQLRAKHPNLKIRIISKDKDLKQLLHDGDHAVELYDVHNDELITAETLKAETGLAPPQVIDMLALMGDTADNVPGIEGVGPKTAAKLVAEHGSIKGVLAAAGTIKGKLGERLRAVDRAQLDLSRRLVTLRHDVPVELPLDSARTDNLNLPAMGPILKELGFNRYQDELKLLIGGSGTGILPVSPPDHATGILPVQTPHSLSPRPAPGGLFPERAPIEMPPAGAPALPASPVAAKKDGKPGPIFGGLFDGAQSAAAQITPQSGEYRVITTRKQLDALLRDLRSAECIAIDTETTGLSPRRDRLVGICLSTKIGTGVYIPVRSPDPASHLDEATVIAALKPILEDPSRPKCGHNLKFDMLVLRKAGIRLGGVSIPTSSADRAAARAAAPTTSSHSTYATPRFATSTAFDSMVASYLIDASRSSHGLDALAMALLGRTNISIKDLIGSGPDQRTFDQVPLEQATQYAAEDADVALQLRAMMLPQLAAMNLMPLFETVEMPLVEVLAELEWNGIRVDRAELERQRMRLQKRIDELKIEISRVSKDTIGRTFNPDSPKQLAAALFNKPDASDDAGGAGLGLKPIKKIKTGYSTDAEVLDKLAADPEIATPIPSLIVEYRELTKLVSTYLVALAAEINPDTGRIHASFNQTVAATGRLSSSDPNLQNIPIRTDIGREIRKAFIAEPAPPHVLVSADYSQIELRLLAHLSRDPALIEAFEKDQDIHTAVAAQIHGVPLVQVTKSQRNGAKMVNFGIVYGVTPFGLARRLGVSNTEAGKIIDDYKRRFAGITTFLQECIDQAVRFGYVQTMLGRRRPIIDIESNNPQRRALAERVAINSVVQGSAADLIKLAMVDLHAAIATGAAPHGLQMLLQIHDELVFECPRDLADAAKALIRNRMEHAMELSVPLKVEASVSENWFDGK
ncbi:MAG: DNA polymerase I [Phycisphaeraceae bacterium]|nr:DNA polymerase I [Phycisphaeraceae bacterium]